MADVRRASWSARLSGGPAFVVLSLTGAWLGHTVQYAIGHGTPGLGPMLGGSVHLYLVPAGAILAAVVFTASLGWARALAATQRRVAAVRAAISGRDAAQLGDTAPPVETSFEPIRLWLMLAGSQLALYVFQENTEANRIHAPAPGLAVLTGRHWTAIPVFLLVALMLVSIVALCQRKRSAEIATLVRELARLHQRLRAALVASAAPSAELFVGNTPLQRWGRQRWERPPPVSLPV
jgi:hypothetical protein